MKVKSAAEMKLLGQQKVKTRWDEEEEKWYFSIIDVIEILTETDSSRKYWNDLKTKLKKEGSELSEKIGQLKLQSSDGKFYKTDVAGKKNEKIAKDARLALENRTGMKVVTGESFLPPPKEHLKLNFGKEKK